jgi:ERCC4-related helicase
MLKHVHRPILCRIDYLPHEASELIPDCRPLLGLITICQRADIKQGVNDLKLGAERESRSKLEKLLSNAQGYNGQQLQKFRDKAKHIYEELGPWAADYFIIESITRLKKVVETEKGLFLGREEQEKACIFKDLSQIAITRSGIGFTAADCPQVSPKLDQLISFLIKEDNAEFSGIIFVRQRATVIVMAELLSVHPKTKNRFQCAPYVGLSNSASRKQTIGELLDLRAQRDTLTDFRDGRKNLIIATDVLEEGIDVTACRLVVCFDSPPNLKSFIQRRGRARQKQSKFAILVAHDDDSATFKNWQKLEEEMIRAYQDDARLLQEVSALESVREDVTDKFRVETTG